MASHEALRKLEDHHHRMPLGGDQIRALANALYALKNTLGAEKAAKTSVYTAILRLLKAHVSPLPGASVSFAQVQAARLQVLAERIVAEGKTFPKELSAAVAQGLVSGFDAITGFKAPKEQQEAQLKTQQLKERDEILRERARLQELHNDFQRTRTGMQPKAERTGPDPAQLVPWVERKLPLPTANSTALQFPTLDKDALTRERYRSLHVRTKKIRCECMEALQEHADGKNVLDARIAALLETRGRHISLLGLQREMRIKIWNEHQLAEREGKPGSKGRGRTLKQLQREYEKVERSRIRQFESEERDARRKRQAWVNSMNDHLNKFRGYHRDVVRRGVRAVTKAVVKHHEDVARNASRAEREAEKARIQKLKDDDEEGYLELVRKTKNTRLLELLDQTDKYLKELGAVVKEERVRSGVVEYENNNDEKDGARRDYYEIAHAIKEEVTEQSSLLVGGTLKEYQLHGIQWMVSLYNNRLNGILADEMGLGKTIQTLALIAHLMERKDNPGPYLIIVPLSTISNWELEFARWAPAIRVVVFKGDAKARKRLYEEVIEKKSFNVCLVTYEYVVRGKTFLKRIEWQHLIIDEGHRIKNHESRLSCVLHDHYRSRNRLLLTGTPLQNSLTELWALLNFLLPNVFKSAESFESWFAAPFAQMGVGNITATDQQAQLTEEESLLIIRRLHQVLRPFLLRRMKADVLRMGEQLPEKQEHIVLCEMSAWQRHMYLKIVKSDRVLFTDRHGRQRYDKLSNPAVQLRKCVNHPYLFFQDHASRIIDSPELWRASGKFDMLDSIITKLLRTDHRILIFNQMTKVVDLQERLLRYRNIAFYRLDGSTSTDDRKQMVNDFNNADSDVHVFLLTTRAGGLGVNLQTADTVIIFDSDWNPSMDQQAQDRAHRIGQRREVLVLRMLTAKTIEEDVMERASFKRGLEKKIIRAGMFDEQSKDSERQAMLRELLRVEGPVSDDENEDGLPTEEEINRLLARSEEEFDIFQDIDLERTVEIAHRPRLLIEKEIPEWAIKVPKALREKAKSSGAGDWNSMPSGFDLSTLNGPKKRRAATTNVSYGLDQLSERAYIRLMERSEAGEEVSLSDAVLAIGKRKRRKKNSEAMSSKDEEEEQDFDKRPDSRVDSEAGTDTVGSRPQGSPISDAMVASKTINADLKSYDDDLTEGGNVTGGEQSCAPSGAEDMIIEDDDDEDDAEGQDKELNVPRNGDLRSGSEGQRSRSEEPDSETSEEGEMDRSPQTAAVHGKTASKEWSGSSKRRARLTRGSNAARRVRPSRRAAEKRSRDMDDSGVERSEASDDSRSGTPSRTKRRVDMMDVATKRVKASDSEDAGEADADVDDVSTEGIGRRGDSGRIPRIQTSRISSLLNTEKASSGRATQQPSEPSENGEIEEEKDMDEEEDGEIREEGELSDEKAEDTDSKGQRRVGAVSGAGGVHGVGRGVGTIPLTVPSLRSIGVPQRMAENRGRPPIPYDNSFRSRYQQATWLTGIYGRAKGMGGNAIPRQGEAQAFNRGPIPAMRTAKAEAGSLPRAVVPAMTGTKAEAGSFARAAVPATSVASGPVGLGEDGNKGGEAGRCFGRPGIREVGVGIGIGNTGGALQDNATKGVEETVCFGREGIGAEGQIADVGESRDEDTEGGEEGEIEEEGEIVEEC